MYGHIFVRNEQKIGCIDKHRLPGTTVMTDNAEVLLVLSRPRPLMRTDDATLMSKVCESHRSVNDTETYGGTGTYLAAT